MGEKLLTVRGEIAAHLPVLWLSLISFQILQEENNYA